jgi:hypothetical protein
MTGAHVVPLGRADYCETAAHERAVAASLTLQHGVPLETIRCALTRNGDGSASGALGTLLDLLASGQAS